MSDRISEAEARRLLERVSIAEAQRDTWRALAHKEVDTLAATVEALEQERDEALAALDTIRADCETAGFPGETDRHDPDSSDPAPIRVWHSTPSLVQMALSAGVAERKAHAVAVEAAYMEGFNDGEQDDGSDTPTKRADLAWEASSARSALRAGEPKP